MSSACPACEGQLAPSLDVLGGSPLQRCTRCETRVAQAGATAPDYDSIYDTREYVENQVRAIEDGGDPDAFARIGTYAPFFARTGPGRGRTLLDVGCGVGRFGRAATARGWRVTGLDVSARAIELGSATAPFPMRLGRIEDAVAAGERYQVVTTFEVLEHLWDPGAFVRSARALLHPGGQLFATVPNWECPEVQTSSRADWVPPVHVLFFTRTGLRELVARCGFDRVEVGVIAGGPPPPGPLRRLRWLGRRILNPPPRLGLWVHAILGGGPG